MNLIKHQKRYAERRLNLAKTEEKPISTERSPTTRVSFDVHKREIRAVELELQIHFGHGLQFTFKPGSQVGASFNRNGIGINAQGSETFCVTLLCEHLIACILYIVSRI